MLAVGWFPKGCYKNNVNMSFVSDICVKTENKRETRTTAVFHVCQTHYQQTK